MARCSLTSRDPALIAAGLLTGFAMTRLWPWAVVALVGLGVGWRFLVAASDGDFGGFAAASAFGFPNAAAGLVFGVGLRALAAELLHRG